MSSDPTGSVPPTERHLAPGSAAQCPVCKEPGVSQVSECPYFDDSDHNDAAIGLAPDTAAFEYEVQGNYGLGWELLTTEDTLQAAREQKRSYDENEAMVPHRVKKVKVEA